MRVPNMTRQELCDAIYKAVLTADEPPTRLEICRLIGRNKSPHIVSMIRDLVAGKWFEEFMDVDKFDRPAFRYRIGAAAAPDCNAVA